MSLMSGLLKKTLLSSVFTFLVFGNSFAFDIKDHIEKVSLRTGVNPVVMLGIAKIESDFKPFAFSGKVRSKYRFKVKSILKTCGVDASYSKKGNYAYFSIDFKNSKKAEKCLPKVLNYFKTFDVGLFQINKWNIERYVKGKTLLEKTLKTFDIGINFLLAKYVITNCYEKYGGKLSKALECYNKGRYIPDRYDYAYRFLNYYEKKKKK